MAALPIGEISPLGWAILGVLAALSVLAATLVLAKLVQFRRARLGDARPAEQALRLWRGGDRGAALSMLEAVAGPRAALLREILTALAAHPGDTARAQARGTQRAIEDLAALERNMRGIEAVVQAAPMLGLLGTVVGMIEAFGRLAQSTGAADPAELAGGIWTALITTALGLAIAIVFYFLSLWLETRITRERAALEGLLAAVPGGLDAPGPATGNG